VVGRLMVPGPTVLKSTSRRWSTSSKPSVGLTSPEGSGGLSTRVWDGVQMHQGALPESKMSGSTKLGSILPITGRILSLFEGVVLQDYHNSVVNICI
jgi:hypothetical protein